MKKIVIVPVFCEAHLVKFQIPNIIDTIDPDVIIYNEGMFPAGPEGSTMVNDEFLETYTLDGVRGFDYNEMKSIVEDARKQYPNTEIILNEMNYDSTIHNSSYHYVQACSTLQTWVLMYKRVIIFFHSRVMYFILRAQEKRYKDTWNN